MKLCPYPFSRVQTTHNKVTMKLNGYFFPCCSSWFSDEYQKLPQEKSMDDVWNGKAAVELRSRMYEGDYSLCNRNECKMPLFTVDELADSNMLFLETPIAPENIEAIRKKDPIMPMSPSSLHLSADLRCNLSCPTCRPKVIPNSSASDSADDEYNYVHKSKGTIEIIKMSSSGEVFYSQKQRELLKSFNSKDFPRLRRVHIVSNGTLFNKKTYDDLAPGTSFIKDVSISIDAGSKEVYEKIRGPYWEQVNSNLIWLGEMRKAQKFDFFSLNFTVIKDNYKDIPNLVTLGKKIGVDRILLQRFVAFPEQGYKTPAEQAAQSIHLDTHPEHADLISILQQYKNEPILYSLLEIPGFEQKIINDVDIKKAWAFFLKSQELLKEKQLEESMTNIMLAIEINPQESFYVVLSEIYYELGLIQEKNKNIESAVHHFNLAIAHDRYKISDENNYIIGRLRTRIYTAQAANLHEDVINSFVIYSKLITPEATVLYTAGSSFKQMSKMLEAEECFTKALALQSNHYYSLFELGFIKQKKENHEQALDYFYQAKEHSPLESVPGINNQIYYQLIKLAQIEKDKGQLKKAVELYSQAQQVEPESEHGIASTQIYYLLTTLAQAEKKEGQIKAALELFSLAKRVEPLAEHGQVDIQMYYLFIHLAQLEKEQNKNNENAIDLYSRAKDIEPAKERGEAKTQIYYLLTELAYMKKEKKMNKEAIDLFSQAMVVEPIERQGESRTQMYYCLVELAFEMKAHNEVDKSIAVFEDALKIEPQEKKGEVQKYLSETCFYKYRDEGFSHQRKGSYKIAAENFTSALKYMEGDADLFFSFAVSLKRTKRIDEAETYFKKVLSLNPKHFSALMELGFIAYSRDNRTLALEDFEQAKKFAPVEAHKRIDTYIRLATRDPEIRRAQRLAHFN